MKWNTHIIIGISYAAITGKVDPVPAALLSAGSIFPDVLDRGFSFGIESLWRRIHRKASHWFIFYLLLILLCVYAGYYYPYYFFIGALLHIYSDALTVSGVPFLNPFESGHGLRTARTGKFSEYILAAIMIGTMFLLNFIPLPLWMSLSAVFVLIAVTGEKNKKTDKSVKQQILLQDLATLWRNNPDKTFEREPTQQLTAETQECVIEQKTPEFGHKQLSDFFTRYVSELPELPVRVITGVMTYLDKYGDCPSVTDKSNDTIPYENGTFQALRNVTLLQHSLNTSEIIVKSVKNPGVYAGQLILAGLGHDIGKVPHADSLNIGDHPKISVMVLNSIKGFRELHYAKEVETAILNHHRAGENDLSEKLFNANEQARKNELSVLLSKVPDNPKIVEPININAFIQNLSDSVNPENAKRLDLFSFNDKIYVKPNSLFKILKNTSNEPFKTFITESASDDDSKKDAIKEAVTILSESNLTDNESLNIKNGYFSAPFTVEMRDGSSQKVYFTPFHLCALINPKKIESRKSGILKEIVAVTPVYQGE